VDLGALSTRQSPPLGVPLRFFLTAPLFVAAGGLVLLSHPEALTDRWSAPMLAVTHAWVLGFMLMIMLGALQQVIPVLIGVPLPAPERVSRHGHLLLTAGTALLIFAFLGDAAGVFSVAAALLAAGVIVVAWPAFGAVIRSPSAHATARGVGSALAALVVTLAFGVWLALGQGGLVPLARQWTDVHLTWGLVGWTVLLVSAVAWQVVPMFQITPRYPRRFMHGFAPALGLALLLWSIGKAADWTPLRLAGAGLLSLVLSAFAAVTLYLQSKRRRRVPDATLDFWRLAMAALVGAVSTWWLGRWMPQIPQVVPVILLAVGFAGSAILGMLYKIVPFLVWLHLTLFAQARGVAPRGIPNMKQVIPSERPRWLFRLHLAWLAILLSAPYRPEWTGRAAGLLALALAGLLFWHLLGAVRLYRERRLALEKSA